MNDTQFYFALGVPFFTLLLMFIATISLNRSAINDLRSDMRAGFSDLGARMNRIEKRLDVIDTEIRINHDHRLAVLEAHVLGRVS